MDISNSPASGGGPQEIPLKTGANFYGHDKANPRIYFGAKGSSRPKQVETLVKAGESYYSNPFLIPTLANLSGGINADGHPRRNRSDGRESEIKVMKAILYNLDFASMMVGTPLDNGFFAHKDMARIARDCAMLKELSDLEIENRIKPQPTRQFTRAWDRLVEAGFMTVSQQYKKEKVIRNGVAVEEYRARPAIKAVSCHFIVALGTMDYKRLEKFRTFCSQQIIARRALYAEKYGNKQDTQKAANAVKALQKAKGITTHSRKKAATPNPTEAAAQQYRQEKVKLQAALIKQGLHDPKAILGKIKARLGSEAAYIKTHA